MFKSLHWKIVLINSLLLLFTLQLIGVYLVQALGKHYLDDYRADLEAQAGLLATFFSPRPFEEQDVEDIAFLVREFRGLWDMEITVLDRYARVVGTSGDQDQIGHRLVQQEITRAMTGMVSEAIRINPANGVRHFGLAFPITNLGDTTGIIYLDSSLESVDATLNEVKMILITGSSIILLISFLLGLILTRTISEPVRRITMKADKMARGDFSQRIEIQSADEIAQLGKSFNHLAVQLSHNMKEISSEKSKVEAMINYMNEGIVALDARGSIIHINPAARTMLKNLKLNIVRLGDSGFPILSELIGENALVSFVEHLEMRNPITYEVSREKPDYVLQVQLVPFQEEKGSSGGTLVVLHDVTKEKGLVRIQQEFVADVSHELRTPLTTVKSYVEALQEGAAKDPALRRRFLQVLEKETERMVNLVKDLLALSQLDYSQFEWQKTSVDLEELAREVVEQIRQKQAGALPKIMISLPPALPPAFADRDRARQVLINLLGNAIKYTPPGGFVEIKAFPEGGMLKMLIADSGVGIPPEDLTRIFERFYRVEKTRSRDYGGTGLGLSIARRIIEAHGGTIWVESSPGVGTSVWFTIPRWEEKEAGESAGEI